MVKSRLIAGLFKAVKISKNGRNLVTGCMRVSGGVEWQVGLSGGCEKLHHSFNGDVKRIQLTFVDLVPINVSDIKLP